MPIIIVLVLYLVKSLGIFGTDCGQYLLHKLLNLGVHSLTNNSYSDCGGGVWECMG